MGRRGTGLSCSPLPCNKSETSLVLPHGTKSEASFGLPHGTKAKHPLVSPFLRGGRKGDLKGGNEGGWERGWG